MGSVRTDVDDISFAQLSLVWDSMTDDLVDRSNSTINGDDDHFSGKRNTHVQTDFGYPR